MQRTLENLILRNENFFYDGDLTINGKVQIISGILCVSGKLFLKGFEENYDLSNARIINGHIIAGSLLCRAHSLYCTGNIIVNSDFNVCHVHSGGDIKVTGHSHAYNVHCRNYLVTGNSDTDNITATEDIYISGYNCSGNLKAREIFLGDFAGFSPYGKITVEAKHFECEGPIRNCRAMKIG